MAIGAADAIALVVALLAHEGFETGGLADWIASGRARVLGERGACAAFVCEFDAFDYIQCVCVAPARMDTATSNVRCVAAACGPLCRSNSTDSTSA